jgi:glycosyltransferase involved in cell wall biosynthesis
MKLLQIASGDFFSTYGGGQVYVKSIVGELIRQELDVAVISFVGKEISVVKCDYKGITLWEIGCQAQNFDIENLVRTIAPDIIHAHSQKALFASLGQQLNIPVVITAHHGGILCPAGTLLNAEDGICQTTLSHRNCLKCCLANIRTGRALYPFIRLLPEGMYRSLGRKLAKLPFVPFITPIGGVAKSIEDKIAEWQSICNNASMVIAPSHAIAEAMCRNGLSRAKVRVIPHGIPGEFNVKSLTLSENENTKHERSASLNTKHEQSEQPIRFFFLGRICRVKGLHVLLDAFDDVCFADRAELHIIGGTGNKGEQRYMKALQCKYRNPNIVWHGKIASDKVLETICDFDVMVHPTMCLEIYGLNISESLLMHKPVLATRCGGAEMQIRDGENGWLVEPNNAIALREKMYQIVENGISFSLDTIDSGVVSIEQHVKDLIVAYEKYL